MEDKQVPGLSYVELIAMYKGLIHINEQALEEAKAHPELYPRTQVIEGKIEAYKGLILNITSVLASEDWEGPRVIIPVNKSN